MSDTTTPKPLTERIHRASATIDGVACVLSDLVHCDNDEASRKSFSCMDLLERISADLDAIAAEVQHLISRTAGKVGAA